MIKFLKYKERLIGCFLYSGVGTMPLFVGKKETHLYDAMTLINNKPLLTRLIVNCLLSGARSDNATVSIDLSMQSQFSHCIFAVNSFCSVF